MRLSIRGMTGCQGYAAGDSPLFRLPRFAVPLIVIASYRITCDNWGDLGNDEWAIRG